MPRTVKLLIALSKPERQNCKTAYCFVQTGDTENCKTAYCFVQNGKTENCKTAYCLV